MEEFKSPIAKVFSQDVSSWKLQNVGPQTEWDPIVQEKKKKKNPCQISFQLEKFQNIIPSKEMPKEGSKGNVSSGSG